MRIMPHTFNLASSILQVFEFFTSFWVIKERNCGGAQFGPRVFGQALRDQGRGETECSFAGTVDRVPDMGQPGVSA